jgi:carbon storage regulator
VLILARRPGEAIVLDGGIRIVVLASDRGSVRLGIEAPAHVTILRGEIAAAVADTNRGAAAANAGDWVARLKGAARDA